MNCLRKFQRTIISLFVASSFLLVGCNGSSNKKYKVEFYGDDLNEPFYSVEVDEGEDAEIPGVPEKEGYLFSRWSTSFSSVHQDLKVYAQFVKAYTVTFYDYDDSIIDLQVVEEGTSVTAPSIPNHTGMEFASWSTTFDNVRSDLNVKTLYNTIYHVTFLDNENNIIQIISVEAGGSIDDAPEAPAIEGYTFKGWNADLSSIITDIMVSPLYETATSEVRFLYPNGSLIDKQTVPYGRAAEAPEHQEIFFDWNQMAGYRFKGWDKKFDSIKTNLDVNAVYQETVTEPILLVDSEDYHNVSMGTTSLTIRLYISGNTQIYGLDISLHFDDLFTIDSYTCKIPNTNETNSVVSVDSSNNLRLAWSNGSKFSVGKNTELLEIKLSIPYRADTGRYYINWLDNSFILNSRLAKVYPETVSNYVEL